MRPEARLATPRVFMEEDLSKIGAPFTVEEAPFTVTKTAPAAAPHAVTKIAPSWELVIAPSAATAVETVTKVEPELEVVVKAKPVHPNAGKRTARRRPGAKIAGGLAEATTTTRTKPP